MTDSREPDVDVRFGAQATGVNGSVPHATVSLGDTSTIATRLAVVADGAGTAVAGIRRSRHDYGQVALIASVWLDAPPAGIAYERFTAEGPMALLPERDHYGLVWTMQPQQGEAMLALDERAFLSALVAPLRHAGHGLYARRFASRVPARARARAADSCRRARSSSEMQRNNCIRSLGQGFNLGLRDAWELAQTILDSPRELLGAPAMLARHARTPQRRPRSGHRLHAWPDSRFSATIVPRSAGRAALHLLCSTSIPPAKRAFTRAMLFGLRYRRERRTRAASVIFVRHRRFVRARTPGIERARRAYERSLSRALTNRANVISRCRRTCARTRANAQDVGIIRSPRSISHHSHRAHRSVSTCRTCSPSRRWPASPIVRSGSCAAGSVRAMRCRRWSRRIRSCGAPTSRAGVPITRVSRRRSPCRSRVPIRR